MEPQTSHGDICASTSQGVYFDARGVGWSLEGAAAARSLRLASVLHLMVFPPVRNEHTKSGNGPPETALLDFLCQQYFGVGGKAGSWIFFGRHRESAFPPFYGETPKKCRVGRPTPDEKKTDNQTTFLEAEESPNSEGGN